MNTIKSEFSPADMKAFEPSEKVGLMASINFEGLPHLTLITSMQANSPTELIVGEFVTGSSKKFIQKNHQIAFLIMTFEREMWRGKATWTQLKKEGPEYEKMNLIPMFRYNTYFGINTVHYFDLLEVTARTALPMNRIILEVLKTKLSKWGARSKKPERILKPLAMNLFNGLTSLKFLSYIKEDGYPTIIPIVQCQAADENRLAFSAGAFSRELRAVPEGKRVAVFCMNFEIEDVLVRGVFNGFRRRMGVELGTVDIEWVYNSMPPALGQVYPAQELQPMTEF